MSELPARGIVPWQAGEGRIAADVLGRREQAACWKSKVRRGPAGSA